MSVSSQTSGRATAAIFCLAVGTITWCVSEPMFWARLAGESNHPGEAALTWLLYCGVVAIALWTLRRFSVSALAGLFLVGAIVGWTIEGAAVPAMYESLPIGISWTALGWHALLTVCGGWLLLPALLRRGGVPAWATCAALGALWGAWSMDPRLDDEVPTLAGGGFAVLAGGVVVGLAGAYAIAWRFQPGPGALKEIRPLIPVGLALIAWATPVTFVPVPFAAPVLAALLALAGWALWRQARAPGSDLIAHPGIGVPPRSTTPLAALALGAILTNLGLDAAGVSLPAVAGVFLVSTIAGFAALGQTIRRAARATPIPAGRGPTR